MTRHDVIREQIAKCRRVMRPAMGIALVGLVATALSSVTAGGGMVTVIAIVTFIAFLLWVSAVLGVSHTVRCPSCHTRLGYLLLDPSYSNKVAPLELPSDIPTTVTECPYCHVDFEMELTEQEASGYRW